MDAVTQPPPRAGVQGRIEDAALRLFAERGAEGVSMSEIARAAGVARGTLYARCEDPAALFEAVAGRLGAEMRGRVEAAAEDEADPAARIARGVAMFVRRAHDEPHWGRFFVRFALSEPNLKGVWDGAMARDVALAAPGRGRDTAVALSVGGTLAAMWLVLDGRRGWRDAGREAAEGVLRAIGVAPERAEETARRAAG